MLKKVVNLCLVTNFTRTIRSLSKPSNFYTRHSRQCLSSYRFTYWEKKICRRQSQHGLMWPRFSLPIDDASASKMDIFKRLLLLLSSESKEEDIDSALSKVLEKINGYESTDYKYDEERKVSGKNLGSWISQCLGVSHRSSEPI